MNNEPKVIKVLITTCVILLLSNSFTYIVLTNKLANFSATILKNPKFPLLDFSRSIKEQKDFIVNLRPLRTNLTKLVDDETNFDISIYIEYLNTGANIAINPELRIFPASLTKIPVAMIMLKKIEETDLNLNSKILITSQDLDSGWGNLYKDSLNKELALDHLIGLSLQESDNAAHNALYRNITPEDVSILAEELGLSDFFDEKGKVTSREYTRIFRALYTSSFLTQKNSQYLLDLLTTATFKDFLNQGLNSQTPFAHKFGEKKSEGVFLDAGIVYEPNRPYLITVLLDHKENLDSEEKQAEAFLQAQLIMKKVSELSYSYMSTTKP